MKWWKPTVGVALWLVFFLTLSVSNWRLVLISADGDACIHRRIGEWMIEHRAVLKTEQFSHTRYQDALISKEWLSEVLFALAGRCGGWNGIILLSAALIATTLWLLYRQLLAEGNDALLALGLTGLAAMASSMHWLARPHLVTHVLTVIFAWHLRAFDLGRLPARRLLWTLPPLMLLWANLHGAFFTGFVLIGVYVLGAPRHAKVLIGLGVACLAASLVTPNGWRLHWQVIQFLRTPELAGMANEFRSPNFHSGASNGLTWLLFILALTLLVVRARWRATEIWLVGVWGYFALHSVRNIPIFAIVTIPVLASHWKSYVETKDWEVYRRWAGKLNGLNATGDGRLLGSAGVAVVVGLMSASVIRSDLLPDRFPTAAVAKLKAGEIKVSGRVFNDYGWGGYMLWALPEHPVFFDGRNDFYGKAVADEFNEVDEVYPGWEDVLNKRQVGWTLLPVKHPLNAVLAVHPNWRAVYFDSVAAIYARN